MELIYNNSILICLFVSFLFSVVSSLSSEQQIINFKIRKVFSYIIVVFISLKFFTLGESVQDSWLLYSKGALFIGKFSIFGSFLSILLTDNAKKVGNIKLLFTDGILIISLFLLGCNNIFILGVTIQLLLVTKVITDLVTSDANNIYKLVNVIFRELLSSSLFILSMSLFLLSTKSFSLLTVDVLNAELYALSVLLLIIYAFMKVGLFPFSERGLELENFRYRDDFFRSIFIVSPVVLYVLIDLLQRLISLCSITYQELMISIVGLVVGINIVKIFLLIMREKGNLKAFNSIIYLNVVFSVFFLLFKSDISASIDVARYIGFTFMYICGFYLSLLSLSPKSFRQKDSFYELFSQFCLTFFVLSIIGVPLSLGFSGRMILFKNAFNEKTYFVSFFIIAMFLVTLPTFMNILKGLFSEEFPFGFLVKTDKEVKENGNAKLVKIIVILLTLCGGVYPSFFL